MLTPTPAGVEGLSASRLGFAAAGAVSGLGRWWCATILDQCEKHVARDTSAWDPMSPAATPAICAHVSVSRVHRADCN
jgi:hypothetical protein